MLEYIVYCPRCGCVSCDPYLEEGDHCNCRSSFADINPKFIKSNLKPEDFDLTKPQTAYGATEEMYRRISEEYVKHPSNKKYNAKAHKKEFEEAMEIFARGGVQNKTHSTPKYKCPKCGSTNTSTGQRGFSKGTAVAGAAVGAAVAGPIGLAGAAVGVAGNKKEVHVCNNCGYKW